MNAEGEDRVLSLRVAKEIQYLLHAALVLLTRARNNLNGLIVLGEGLLDQVEGAISAHEAANDEWGFDMPMRDLAGEQ